MFQAPASPPQNLTVTPVDSRNVHLSWSPPPEHHNGVIRQFWINITEADTGRRFQLISVGTSFTVSSLHPFYTYSFQIAAYTVNLGPFSEPSLLQMPQDGKDKFSVSSYHYESLISMFCYLTVPSSPPRNSAAVALSSRSVLLTWDAPPVEGQNGIITGYTVNITELETGEVSTMFIESRNLTLYSLRPFTTYGLLVSAQTIAGRGPTTHLLSVTTQEEGLAINTSTISRWRLFYLELQL